MYVTIWQWRNSLPTLDRDYEVDNNVVTFPEFNEWLIGYCSQTAVFARETILKWSQITSDKYVCVLF